MPVSLTDRRTSPRLYVDTSLSAHLLGAPIDIVCVRDLGLDGFAVESLHPEATGRRDDVRFVTDGGLAVRVRAEVVYSRYVDVTQPSRYVNGYRFIADGPEAEKAVGLLVDAVTSPIMVD